VSVAVVKLQSRPYRGKGEYYSITVPTEIVKELGWKKGDILVARVLEVEVDGTKRKALVYYRPQL